MSLRHLVACVVACGFLGASVAEAQEASSLAGKQLAFLQPKNIFRNGLRGTHTVALTFDDGPNDSTRDVLSALDAYQVKATFFIVGQMAKTHPDVLALVAKAGHLLGNHSATHSKLGYKFAKQPRMLVGEIRQVHSYIAPLMKPNDTLFFRAPYGYWMSEHATVLNRDPQLRNYVGPIYWDEGGQTRVDRNGAVLASADWDCWDHGWSVAACARGYLNEIEAKDGGVVLMHAIHPKAAALVKAIIPVLQREGFKFVRLDQVKEYDHYKTPPRSSEPAIAMAAAPAIAMAAQPRTHTAPSVEVFEEPAARGLPRQF